MMALSPEKRTCATIWISLNFQNGEKGVVIKLLWFVVLKICFEKLATMIVSSALLARD